MTEALLKSKPAKNIFKIAMSLIDDFTSFIERAFKTSLKALFQALRMSPNAQGYIGGSITEILLMNKLKKHLLWSKYLYLKILLIF